MIYKQLKLIKVTDRASNQEKYVEYYNQPVVLMCDLGQSAMIAMRDSHLKTSWVTSLPQYIENGTYLSMKTTNSLYVFEPLEGN